MKGSLNSITVRLLKDDGCNTNLASTNDFKKHMKRFEVRRKNVRIHHPRKRFNVEISYLI